MANELEGLAKNLTDSISGKGGINFERLMRILATDAGKRILASLLSDGGERVKRAAYSAKTGDMSGVQSVIESIAETEEGRELLGQLMRDAK